MINEYCPNCKNVLILELQIDDKKMKSRLHKYCEKCGYDVDVDPFHTRYREAMTEFCEVISRDRMIRVLKGDIIHWKKMKFGKKYYSKNSLRKLSKYLEENDQCLTK
jgi:hypothetical protein